MSQQISTSTQAPPSRGEVLVAGASFAGLATAYWMNRLGYKVTIVEIGDGLKRGGTPVDIREGTVDIVRRMGLFEQTWARRLKTRPMTFKDFDGVTTVSTPAQDAAEQQASGDYEIDRDVLLDIMFEAVKDDVEFMFDDSIAVLEETEKEVVVTFKSGSSHAFSLLFGCDGNHSALRRMHFGPEAEYAFFMRTYFAIAVIGKLLIAPNTSEIYNSPGKAVMLNSYDDKTDVVFTFFSETEVPYDHRDREQQRRIVLEHFAGDGAMVHQMMEVLTSSDDFYFDKFCQVKMPSWTKGRVALVGDAGYCASPAAGMGGSLAIVGATALADAMAKYPDDFELAFNDYNKGLRPFVERVQSDAISFGLEMFGPLTDEAIRERNAALAG